MKEKRIVITESEITEWKIWKKDIEGKFIKIMEEMSEIGVQNGAKS